MKSALNTVLICPNCHANWDIPVSLTKSCSSCGYTTSDKSGSLWWLRNPTASSADWQNRIKQQLGSLQRQLHEYQEAEKRCSTNSITSARIKSGAKSLENKINQTEALVGDLFDENDSLMDLSISSDIPMRNQLFSYERNILRDWAWNTNENELSAQHLLKCINNANFQRMAVLGSGASRLAFDIARNLKIDHTICIDIHPLLLSVPATLYSGESLKWTEQTVAPKSTEDSFKTWDLLFPSEFRSLSFDFLYADGTVPPLQDGSCDLVLTPWFLDIIPKNVEHVVREINRTLAMDGIWLYHGSYFFNSNDPLQCLSKEELFELAERCGFEIESVNLEVIPYLNSPLSCDHRSETVLSFAAMKISEVEVYEPIHALTEWIEDTSLPIPKLATFEEIMLVNKVHTEVLASVNGHFSIQDLAKAVSQQYSTPVDQAEAAIREMFKKIIEKQRLGQL